jgi:hypothetical protein
MASVLDELRPLSAGSVFGLGEGGRGVQLHRSSPRGATKMSHWGPFANASEPMQSPLTAD